MNTDCLQISGLNVAIEFLECKILYQVFASASKRQFLRVAIVQ